MPAPGAYIEAGGVRQYTETHGAGDSLLLLHGGFETVDMLPDLTAALAERFRVIAPERRGHGRSPDVDGPITYEAMARDVIALIDALDLRQAHIVGYSDGANIGMLIAVWRPDLVRRLVLVSGNYDASGMTRQFVLGMRRATAERFDPSFVEAYQRLSPDGADHWPVVFEKLKRMMLEEPSIPREELGRITAPTLVLAGDRDFVSVEHTVDLFKAIPDARLCIVPGGSHGLLTEQPAPCNQVILEFLS